MYAVVATGYREPGDVDMACGYIKDVAGGNLNNTVRRTILRENGQLLVHILRIPGIRPVLDTDRFASSRIIDRVLDWCCACVEWAGLIPPAARVDIDVLSRCGRCD